MATFSILIGFIYIGEHKHLERSNFIEKDSNNMVSSNYFFAIDVSE